MSLTSASGRKRPVIFAISVKLERPHLGKAAVQILDFEKS